MSEQSPEEEWWRSPPQPWWETERGRDAAPGGAASSPPGPGPDASSAGGSPGPADPPLDVDGTEAQRSRWNSIRESWSEQTGHGQEGLRAAEIGAEIGEAISSRLPDPHAMASRRGLDIRWMRLKYNVPGILLATLVTWRGQSATARMADQVAENGVFAPLGWVLMGALVLGVFMLLPIGSWLGSALAHVVTWIVQGTVAVIGRGWRTPYIGYVLRLVVAVAAWSFVFAVLLVMGRETIRWLTGA
ncbi:hypothetical protein [Streptomyces triticirhizae]|uniref:hypothetical protein n=1 Tax=Streptomyces triticirhizae TaxID=2483353 RepID=UPI0011C48076|nr:hypothetical protein [Streptomyces triticirhizae]